MISNLRISRKAESFTESVIREMNRVAAAHGAVSLAQGFPDFACPPELKRAVAEAVDADLNQYAITWGSKPLRDAIAETTPRHFPGFGEIDPETQVTVTCGATEAMIADMEQDLGPMVMAKKVLPPDDYAFTWVVDFPLVEWDADEKRYIYVHHPFTSPHDDDLAHLESEPGTVRAKAYDLVLNGSEIGGGSIRIHDSSLQRRIFSLLNISDEDARTRFGFFLEALEYGTPPHGGIALGLDRIIAILSAESSIREVIAFPKTAAAVDLMSDAPSPVDPRQLRELHINLTRT